MNHIMLMDLASGSTVSPEEQLKCYVADALQKCGYPPLQYFDVEARDGHVYLSARVPTLFLAKRTFGRDSDEPRFETANGTQPSIESVSS